jgi:hypothetical protein
MKKALSDEYSEAEAQRRFQDTLKAALSTPPKPLKSLTPKATKAQSKKRKKAK